VARSTARIDGRQSALTGGGSANLPAVNRLQVYFGDCGTARCMCAPPGNHQRRLPDHFRAPAALRYLLPCVHALELRADL